MDLCNYGTFESGLVYTHCKSGRKKNHHMWQCALNHLQSWTSYFLALLYFCFLFLNKPAIIMKERKIQNRAEVAFRSSS